VKFTFLGSRANISSVLVKKFLNALFKPGMAFKAIWQTSENWLSGLKNAVFLCLLENIYKDTHFQPLDQIFKVKKV
jgi:hypothetical protein